ncbi:MAG: cobalt-precorrin-5B (C(1))-methyltransferase [Bacteroidaceae bacterium]|nr:cobalt-precorrin-5B (C(1))-methyltransferase [Bacteroidaceae bacterium]
MILILGGTTEGRMAVKVADEAGRRFWYSTRGDLQQVESHNGEHVTGAMDTDAMTAFCREHEIRLIVDAAHPFAVKLHATVCEVSQTLSIPVIRYERTYPERTQDITWCDDYADAINRLEEAGIDNLLALTGVQTISALRPYWDHHKCIFRVLDREESVEMARKAGFNTDNLVFYGNGSDLELMCEVKPQAVITKESGLTGGFMEKAAAALELGIPLYAVKRPELPADFITVTGEHGLRKEIERLVPGFYELRTGFTTGACATAAAKAALTALLSGEEQTEVRFSIPDGEFFTLPVQDCEIDQDWAQASVVKDAGDDPDVTNGCTVCVKVALSREPGVHFLQGEGVGRITLPGIGLEVGEPAVNPVPRRMITEELTALYDGGLDVTVSVPGGAELAQKTFNPKLGIVDGISIIGTLGVVRPFSSEAFVEAIRREVEVAKAVGTPRLVINSGARSERFVKAQYPDLPAQAFVHYGNYIGETLSIAQELGFHEITMGLMIGKAVKLAAGMLDTHSREGVMDKKFIRKMARESGCSWRVRRAIGRITLARELWALIPQENIEAFASTVIRHCHTCCDTLLKTSNLTILLISENGKIY